MNHDRYLNALLTDLNAQLPMIDGRKINTIFFGGGTPSLFSGKHYRWLLARVSELVELDSQAEITLEANPGTIEHDGFAAYRAAGINRVSLGVQSFDDAMLKRLGRIHDKAQVRQAVESIRTAGFSNFNLDLMHGLPGQTLEGALSDLQQAISFEPTHLSWYQLTIEPNTVFYKQRPILPAEGLLAEIEQQGQRIMMENGYQRYEISAYCKESRQCLHNLNYWQFGDYLGLGAGAHSKVTVEGVQTRFEKHRMPKEYTQNPQANLNRRAISAKDLGFEYILMVSRCLQPISKAHFSQATGSSIEQFRSQWNNAIAKGLLVERADCFEITSLGRQYLNELQALFL